jgi:hypothetical protein
LKALADAIDRVGLRVPLGMALDVLRPLDFLSSQAILFVRPFTHGSAWERYTLVLTEEQSWGDLRRLLDLEGQKSAGQEPKTGNRKPETAEAEKA